MHRIARSLARIDSTLVRGEIWAAGILAGVMVAVIFLQVVFRYALQSSLAWSEELGRYLLVWVAMIGASIGVQKRTHFGLEILKKALPEKMQSSLLAVISFMMLVFCIILSIEGVVFVFSTFDHTSSAMDLPMPWVYFSLPIAGTFMTYHLLFAVLNFFHLECKS